MFIKKNHVKATIHTFFTLPQSVVAVSSSRVLRVFIRCFRALRAVAVGFRVRTVAGRGSVAGSGFKIERKRESNETHG